MTLDELVVLENRSIREFVHSQRDLLTGRVLDYGCGRSPYRDIVEAAGGTYVGYDRSYLPANMSREDVGEARLGDWHDVVLCTQVLQFVPDPLYELQVRLKNLIRPGGHLILTYPTTWPIVNVPEDLWRFTEAGMGALLARAGFTVTHSRVRAMIPHEDAFDLRLPVGYGAVARA